MIADLIARLAGFVHGLESWQQIGALILIGAIPFIESYNGSLLGTLVGISPYLAVPATVLGNIACTFALVAVAIQGRDAITRNRDAVQDEPVSPRRQKVARYFDRFGVPGVSLLGPLVLASQFTAPILIALGANRRSVYVWTGISILAWGVLFGFFGNAIAAWMG